jgi:hypothetical protein
LLAKAAATTTSFITQLLLFCENPEEDATGLPGVTRTWCDCVPQPNATKSRFDQKWCDQIRATPKCPQSAEDRSHERLGRQARKSVQGSVFVDTNLDEERIASGLPVTRE